MSDDDCFMAIVEHDNTTISLSRTYLGVDRSDDLVVIQITASSTRTPEKKKALYASIAR